MLQPSDTVPLTPAGHMIMYKQYLICLPIQINAEIWGTEALWDTNFLTPPGDYGFISSLADAESLIHKGVHEYNHTIAY